MFERFTERAREAVVLAQHEARGLGLGSLILATCAGAVILGCGLAIGWLIWG